MFFTWRHLHHIGVPKQSNGGHVGVPNHSCESQPTFIFCKNFNLHTCWPREWKLFNNDKCRGFFRNSRCHNDMFQCRIQTSRGLGGALRSSRPWDKGGHPDPEGGGGLQNFFRPFGPQLACFRLSDTGEDAKEKGTRKVALSQFSGPDYLGAWNRLGLSLV